MTESVDRITEFYNRHPYPPAAVDLSAYQAEWADPNRRRVEHHRLWPSRRYREDHSILIAGCGTSQAARYAIRYPSARVVGVDVSSTGLGNTRTLAAKHGLDNLELRELAIEQVAELGAGFDHIVCTGVLHHLAEPEVGLRALRQVLEPAGALHLMVYAPYGRAGIYMIQDYCRRLGIGTSPSDIADLVASLRELPTNHPLGHLLRDTPDFHNGDALADALLNPRDRAYAVPELFELLARAELRFGRWVRQAGYLSVCGSLATVPHGPRIAQLDPVHQYAAVELFRGTMTRHSLIAHRADGPDDPQPVRFDTDQWHSYVPLRPSTVISVDERLPPGAAAALLNRAHVHHDLVLFVDAAERRIFDAIDGRRTIGQIAGRSDFFERLWQHDLIVIDASNDRR